MPHGPACPCEECLAYRSRQEQIGLYLRFFVIVLGFCGVFVAVYVFLTMAFPNRPNG